MAELKFAKAVVKTGVAAGGVCSSEHHVLLSRMQFVGPAEGTVSRIDMIVPLVRAGSLSWSQEPWRHTIARTVPTSVDLCLAAFHILALIILRLSFNFGLIWVHAVLNL